MVKTKPTVKGKNRRQTPVTRSRAFKPRGFSFKREAEWMTMINLAPFAIGVVLALVFWFTR